MVLIKKPVALVTGRANQFALPGHCCLCSWTSIHRCTADSGILIRVPILTAGNCFSRIAEYSPCSLNPTKGAASETVNNFSI
jgi:hypothetical protein